MPQTSILIPVYNGLPYLKETIASVLNLNQRDWKLLISDNASTDGTTEYLKEIRDERIEIFYQQENIGANRNWKFLYDQCETEFACLLGADDCLHPHFLNTLEPLLLEQPEAGFAHSSASFIDANGKNTGTHKTCFPACMSSQEFIKAQCLSNQVNVTTCLFRLKESKNRGVTFDSNLKLLFDWALWLDISQQFKFVAYSNTLTCSYRIHSKNVTSSTLGSNTWHLDHLELIADRFHKIDAQSIPQKLRYDIIYKALMISQKSFRASEFKMTLKTLKVAFRMLSLR